jgi:hypothetical protein
MKMSRTWAMPSADTLTIKPFRGLVKHYLQNSKVSVDPFARNCRWATYTNDLNPDTAAEYHMDAREFLRMLIDEGVQADVVIFDPPYSPRQISECYQSIGRTVTMKDTQNAVLFAECKKEINELLIDGGYAICFGWNSSGMQSHGNFMFEEILVACHGAGRNDTICTVERKLETPVGLFTELSGAQIKGLVGKR